MTAIRANNDLRNQILKENRINNDLKKDKMLMYLFILLFVLFIVIGIVFYKSKSSVSPKNQETEDIKPQNVKIQGGQKSKRDELNLPERKKIKKEEPPIQPEESITLP